MAALVADCYGLPGAACRLLVRGINDTYAVQAGGDAYFFRISGARGRGRADVAAETAFIAHLHQAGVPVAPAAACRDGALWTQVSLPQGDRPGVLFQAAPGRRPELDDPEDARVQGATLAQLHNAADAWSVREAGRYRLDLDHLLHRPLAAITALGFDTAALTALAARLDAAVRALPLTLTRCHGDCHGLNARIAGSGPGSVATFFDFDDGGFGYLAYDLAVYLWAQVTFGRRRFAMWYAFLEGYRAHRPITPVDLAAIELFVPIRHIWLTGEYAGRTAEWGSEIMSEAVIARETVFLLAWERERIAPGLLG